MTTAEAVAKIEAQNIQLVKVTGEVVAIKQALADAQTNGDIVPPAIEAAINASGTTIQALDDLNADAEDEVAPAE